MISLANSGYDSFGLTCMRWWSQALLRAAAAGLRSRIVVAARSSPTGPAAGGDAGVWGCVLERADFDRLAARPSGLPTGAVAAVTTARGADADFGAAAAGSGLSSATDGSVGG